MLNSTEKIIKHKTGLLNLAEELGNVSKACQVMGYSRDTFYRYKSAVDGGGVEALHSGWCLRTIVGYIQDSDLRQIDGDFGSALKHVVVGEIHDVQLLCRAERVQGAHKRVVLQLQPGQARRVL